MPRFAVLLAALALVACAEPGGSASEAAVAPGSPPADAAPAEAAPTAEAAADGALRSGAAPDFTLPSADGAPVRLADLLAEGPVVLTFYRGAWCPYCNTQLRDYQARLDEIEAAGAQLVAISPEVPDSSRATRDANALAFPVLSDAGHRVSRDYGLVFRVDGATRDRYEAVGIDLARAHGGDAWELPVPATYVIDRDGTIRSAFVEADYTQRASVGQVLEALRAL